MCVVRPAKTISAILTRLAVYANSVLAVYDAFPVFSVLSGLLTALDCIRLNSRRSIDNRFLDDFTSFSLASLENTSSGRQQSHVRREELESITCNVPVVSNPVSCRRPGPRVLNLWTDLGIPVHIEIPGFTGPKHHIFVCK